MPIYWGLYQCVMAFRLLIVGGGVYGGDSYSNQTHMYVNGSRSWTKKEDRRTGVQDHVCGRVRYPDGTIKVVTVGGYPENELIRVYDPESDVWTKGGCWEMNQHL